MGAILSGDQVYRYALWRELATKLGAANAENTVLFIMLNPSTADALKDDPTIRRCQDFARTWGYGRMAVANLYAFRATKPTELFQTGRDPVGPECDQWIEELAEGADKIIGAWGATGHPGGIERVDRVRALCGEKPVFCLRRTKQGHPQHPLYLPRGLTPPVKWEPK